MKVHLLHGGFNFEGSRVLSIYSDEKVAKDLCEKLEKHRKEMPTESSGDYITDEVALQRWEETCPVQGAHYDYYHIISMEVI